MSTDFTSCICMGLMDYLGSIEIHQAQPGGGGLKGERGIGGVYGWELMEIHAGLLDCLLMTESMCPDGTAGHGPREGNL